MVANREQVAAGDRVVEMIVEAVVVLDDTGSTTFGGHGVAAGREAASKVERSAAVVKFTLVGVAIAVPPRFIAEAI